MLQIFPTLDAKLGDISGVNIYNCVQRCYDFSEITSKLVNVPAYWRVASVCNQKLEVLLFVL